MKKLIITTSLVGTLLFGGQAHADSTYIVRSGDTLSGIAKTYQISVDSILQANKLSSTNIFVGQTLTIPSDLEIPGVPLVEGSTIIKTGEQYLGARYLFGASETRTDAFDCSSFTMRVFLENGIILPRMSKDQAKAGKEISLSEAKPGDLLFFDTNRNGQINHVGIYVSPNKMINSASSTGVAYVDTKAYWNARFVKAVRVLLPQPNTQYAMTAANVYEGPFRDISNIWNKEQILYLYDAGIIQGSGDQFLPNAQTSRVQLAVMLFRALQLEETAYDGRFSDVSSSDWYSGQLMTIAETGMIKGEANGTFNPNGSVTRAQAAKMIEGALKVKGFDESKLDATKSINQFSDYSRIPTWSIESVDILVKADVISGKADGSFDPNGNLTRAQMVKLIYKMLELTN
ncbi:S-layer homology domain-containing protein [Bacillus salitolerans]|uniref:S-layer homology domain-containing protein n=1 Tax=Bacillus salitolerans TaxID=1437434 RepID=A0ABW4LT92_9BACI